MIRIVQIGLGPIGLKLTKTLSAHPLIEVVSAIDLDKSKQGRDLGELAGLSELGISVEGEIAIDSSSADVAVVTTTSSFEQIAPLLSDLISRGWDVVSTCEELSFPWVKYERLSRQIDEEARAHRVSVLGTGINPGFLMDFLPVVLSGICTQIDQVVIERVMDAGQRRIPFQKKIGAGLQPEEFERLVAEGRLGHVGLTESMQMLSRRLGWTLDSYSDTVEAVIAPTDIQVGETRVAAGQVAGLLQTGRGSRNGQDLIRLVFRACVGEPRPYDQIELKGRDPVRMVIEGGVNGDSGTTSITTNAAVAIREAPPGLRTMADIAPISCFRPASA